MSDLNPSQQRAIEYTSGPLIIVAGAGTGKTTVITKKIAYLIEQKLATSEQILALTFTEKAAHEMVERVDKLLNIGYADLQISTFHAFCQRLLEQYGLDIGLPNRFKVLTETEAWLLVRQNLKRFNLNYYRPMANPTRHIHELIKHFSKCKDELLTPERYIAYVEEVQGDTGDMNVEEKSRLTEVANSYHIYNQLLLENDSLDFGDLIFYTHKLLSERPNILRALQNRYRYILVDEFQDVNWSQYQLVRLLTKKDKTTPPQLTVVGDDDQSIYAFRGASVSNILRFKDDYKDAEEVVLTENYRSNQTILDVAYKLIQNNNPDRLEVKLNINKQLISKKENSENSNANKVEYFHCSKLDDEVQAVIDKLKELKTNDLDLSWSECAVLVRANNHAEPFITALEKSGIPYEFLASAGLFRQRIVIDALNFFKVIDSHHESSAVYRLLLIPFWKFSENDLQKFTFAAKKKSISYYEALKRVREFGLSDNGIQTCDKIISLIHDGMRQTREEKPSKILYSFLENSGYLKYLSSEEEGNASILQQIHFLNQFFEHIVEYETTHPENARISGFLEYYQYLVQAGEEGSLENADGHEDAVKLMTVHAAKGLEFLYVFIVNLVEERFPTRRRGESIELPAALVNEELPSGDAHYQEERRLFYVALTRAKEKLFLLSSEDYGGVREKKISRFLAELGFEQEEKKNKKLKKEIKAQASSLNDEVDASKKKVSQYTVPEKFSFSQIKSYETCPYQYKLAHILKVPTKGNASFSFGQTIHSALQKFYERIQELNAVKQVSLFGTAEIATSVSGGIKVPTVDDLLKLYDQVWIEDWYRDTDQREEYYEKGKKILREFYKTHEGQWTIPVSLEGWFKIKVGEYLLHGRIDRIDKLPDGTLEIIDYKTGKAKEKVTGEDKDQLLIYQLATEQLPQYRYMGATQKLTFYYINDNIKVSFLGTPEELRGLQEKLISVIERIHSGDFVATPSQFVCGSCDFRDICDFRVF
jgi:DNA helicase-2/ATP-dependent DNA helicase PcrA